MVAVPALLLLAKLVVDLLARWRNVQLVSVATSVSVALVAVMLLMTEWDSTATQVMRLERERGVGDGLWGYFDLFFILVAPFAVLLVCSVGAVVAAMLLGKSTRRVLSRTIPVAAVGVTAALLLLTAFGVVRAHTWESIDSRIAALLARAVPASPDYEARSLRPFHVSVAAGEHRTTAGDLTVVYDCDFSQCQIGIVDDPAAPRSIPAITKDAPRVAHATELVLIRDALDLALIRATELRPMFSVGRPAVDLLAFRHVEGRWQSEPFRPGFVTGRASPPLPWIVLGCAGLLLTALPWMARLRAARRGRRLARAAAGTLSEDGWVLFPQGPAARVMGAPSVPPGPVLVLDGPANGGPYPNGLALPADALVAGTHEVYAEATEREVLKLEAMALAIASLATTPLAAAAMAGLVW